MGKVHVKAEIDIQQFLSQLDTAELEAFSKEISAILVRRKNKDNKTLQTRLLQQLNEECVLSEEHWTTFKKLIKKREERHISPDEIDQLSQLIKEEENLRLKRINILGELARLKGISLAQLSKELGIEPAKRD